MKKLLKWILIIFIGFFVLGIVLSIIGGNSNSKTSATKNTASAQENMDTKPEQKEVANNWHQDVQKDEMRGTELRFTATESTNTEHFEFPYNGGSNLILIVRTGNSGNDVMIRISKGQFLCNVVGGCEVNFKFDDGAIESITFVEPESYDSDLLFVKNPGTVTKIISKLEKAKQLTIEPSFFQYGKVQFKFNVEGFKKP